MANKVFQACIIMFCSVVVLQAEAWREGNGGDGIRVQKQLYLLDLVESGVELDSADAAATFTNPFFEKQITTWAALQSHPVPQKQILEKLGQVYQKNALLAHLIVMALWRLEWTWVNVPIKDVKDQGTVTVLDDPKLEQLAVRVNQAVYLQADLWKELNPRNQAALLFHEALFALVHPKRSPQGLSMSSPRVRKIVGFLFSEKLQQASIDDLLKIEAPELRFTSLSLKPITLFQFDASKGEMLFNAHWTLRAQNAQGETTILNEVGLGESASKTVRHICEFSAEANTQLSVGIVADRIAVELKTDVKNAYEDYYLMHDYFPEMQLLFFAVNGNLSADNCADQIKAAKKVLLTDFNGVAK